MSLAATPFFHETGSGHDWFGPVFLRLMVNKAQIENGSLTLRYAGFADRRTVVSTGY